MDIETAKVDEERKRLLAMLTKYAGKIRCEKAKGGCGGEWPTQAQAEAHFDFHK